MQLLDSSITIDTATGLYQLLEKHAAQRPDAIYCYSAESTISYAAMCQRARRTAQQLSLYRRENHTTVIAAAIADREALLTLIWGALRAGVCLAFLPESADCAQAESLRATLDAAVIITDNPALAEHPRAATWQAVAESESDTQWQQGSIDPNTAAFIFQTSGTTGAAKWVEVTHQQFAAAIASMGSSGCLDHAFEQTVFVTPPLFHSYGLSSLLEYTSAGASIILPPERSALGAVGDLMDAALAKRVTAIEAVPHFYAQLVRLLRRVDLPALRHAGFGGGKLETAVVEQMTAHFPTLSYSVRYGLTETPSVVSQKVFRFPYDNAWHSSGKVLPIYDIRIVDELGERVAQGNEGEITLKGASLAWPYWGEAASDAYFSTGDIGYFDANNELCIVGRNSLFIKVRGYRISPETIEAAIRTFPAVVDCRVSGKDEMISAEILPTAPVTKQDLLTHLSTQLPSYALPTLITTVSRIPRTPSGKIIRH